MKVGFVGLGIMGKPMAKNLLKNSDHTLRFFARKPEVIAEMQELLTKVRLGLALGFFQVRGNDPYALDNLIDSMRPYSFCANYEQMDATPLQRNLKRAAVLRRKLPLIIEKV